MIPSSIGLLVTALGFLFVYLGVHGTTFLPVTRQQPLVPTPSGTGSVPAQ